MAGNKNYFQWFMHCEGTSLFLPRLLGPPQPALPRLLPHSVADEEQAIFNERRPNMCNLDQACYAGTGGRAVTGLGDT